MDEESHSTSHDSSNSREAVQMNTGAPLHNVNLREAHCVLCRRIYSLGNEANWHDYLNICQDCEVLLPEHNALFIRTFRDRRPLRRSRNRYSRISGRQKRMLESYQYGHEQRRQHLEEIRQHLEEARQDLEEDRRNFQSFQSLRQHLRRNPCERTEHILEFYRCQVDASQRQFEYHQQQLEQNQRHIEQLEPLLEQLAEADNQQEFDQLVERYVQQFVEHHLEQIREVLADIRNSRGEAALLPTTLSFVESLPRVIITEEHEKKHDGLVCAICTDPLSVGTIVNQLPCLHFYHPLCIVPWLKVRRSCPTCRYKLSSAFHNETRQNTNRRMGFRETVQEGFSVNNSSATSNVNEPEVVVSESRNETTDSSVRDREGIRGGWFLFAAAPIVSLVGIALVECFQNLLGDGRGRGRAYRSC